MVDRENDHMRRTRDKGYLVKKKEVHAISQIFLKPGEKGGGRKRTGLGDRMERKIKI